MTSTSCPIAAADDVFGAALFALSCYAREAWAFEMISGRAPCARSSIEALHASKDPDRIARAFYLQSAFTPLGPAQLALPETGALTDGRVFELKEGRWRCGSMGEALIGVETVGARRVLRLAFRGTEAHADPSAMVSLARLAAGRLLATYSHIGRHLDRFEPLCQAVCAYALDPANAIDELHVCGHSLGASCAEEFFKRHCASLTGVKAVGFGFGSPGSGDGTRSVLASAAKRLGLEYRRPDEPPCPADFHQLADPKDPVPRIGALFHRRLGDFQALALDAVSDTPEAPSRFERLQDARSRLAAHSMARYAKAAERRLIELSETHRASGSEPSARLFELNVARERANAWREQQLARCEIAAVAASAQRARG